MGQSTVHTIEGSVVLIFPAPSHAQFDRNKRGSLEQAWDGVQIGLYLLVRDKIMQGSTQIHSSHRAVFKTLG